MFSRDGKLVLMGKGLVIFIAVSAAEFSVGVAVGAFVFGEKEAATRNVCECVPDVFTLVVCDDDLKIPEVEIDV